MTMRRILPLAIILLFVLLSCSTVHREEVFRNGVVVSSETAATDVGVRILKEGGNAIDAACATALALAVSYPQAGNIGGGGFALVYTADSQRVSFLDFRETAPQAATADMFLDDAGKIDDGKARYSAKSSGVPGTVAGLWEMHRRFGKKPWQELAEPARRMADTGIIVTSALADDIASHREHLTGHEASEALFFPDGGPLTTGNRWVQADLAKTLSLIGLEGKDGFYSGEVAEKIAHWAQTSGGLITAEDLAGYQPQWRTPVLCSFGQLSIYAAGLPSSGGIVMAEILKMLGPYELDRYTPNSPKYIHLFAEAARRAYADRSEYLGDPDFTPNMTSGLLEASYIASRMQTFDPDKATPSSEVLPGSPRGRTESDNTTHLIVADRDGNIVSLTYTINLTFGSGIVVPGCGFLMNNEMDDFAAAPGQPNAFGLVGGEANKIEGGKRMLSSMTPTIVLKNGVPYLALGSPGGSKIITAVTETLLNYHVFGMSLAEAIDAPRFHHQWLPDKLYVEKGGYDPLILDKLRSMGYDVVEREPYCEVMGVEFSPDGFFKTGVADARAHGTAKGY